MSIGFIGFPFGEKKRSTPDIAFLIIQLQLLSLFVKKKIAIGIGCYCFMHSHPCVLWLLLHCDNTCLSRCNVRHYGQPSDFDLKRFQSKHIFFLKKNPLINLPKCNVFIWDDQVISTLLWISKNMFFGHKLFGDSVNTNVIVAFLSCRISVVPWN